MSSHHLAQFNIATAKEPLDSPVMAEFVANLDHINALAEKSPGFVWRLADDTAHAAGVHPFSERVLVNLSVWEDVASLQRYTFTSAHVAMIRRRSDWFERMSEVYAVLWWIPRGHVPTVEEAAQRLAHLRANGPTELAFTFKEVFPPPNETALAVE